MAPSARADVDDHVICVPLSVTGCDAFAPTIQLALNAAAASATDDTVRIAAGSYSDGPWTVNPDGHALLIKGAGQATTTLTMPGSPTLHTYLSASNATVEDLTVHLTAANSSGDTGISVDSGVLRRVTVDGPGTDNVKGVYAHNATIASSAVLLPLDSPSGNVGVYSWGGTNLTDTQVSGTRAIYAGDDNNPTSGSRLRLSASTEGVFTDGGTVSVDNSLIDLGTSGGIGLYAENGNSSPNPMTINANHVTIVGGGTGSRGIRAVAASAGAQQSATVHVSNSVVSGPETSIQVIAGHSGNVAQVSTATVTLAYSDWSAATQQVTVQPGGAGVITPGAGVLDGVDPQFVDPAGGNYRLEAGSPLVDKGDPAAAGPATDLDTNPRVQDGDADGTAVRDMGAYELGDTTPPETTIDSGPNGPTTDATPTFTFSSSEQASSFECKVDGGAGAVCQSPLTTSALADGPHTLTVVATDAAGNPDASPASRAFTVDTVAPDTTISSGPAAPTSDSTPTFVFGSEAGATFECRVDGASFTPCSSPLTTGTLGEGAHTFSVRAKDAATNLDPTPATRSFAVDTTAPETTITKKPSKRTSHARVKVKFPWLDSGEPRFECRLDKGAFKPCTSPYKVTVKVGKHTIEVRAIDALGNVDPTPAKVRFRRVPRS